MPRRKQEEEEYSEGSYYSDEDSYTSYSDDDGPRGGVDYADYDDDDEEDYGYEDVQPRTRAPSPNRLDRGGVSSRRKRGSGTERRSSGRERHGATRTRGANTIQRHTAMSHVDGSDPGGMSGSGRRHRGVPRRAKSSDDVGYDAGPSRGGRRPPARSKSSVDGYRPSGERMPRRKPSGTMDKKLVASNRARRLRAVGDSAGPRRPKLESASSLRKVPGRSMSCGPGLAAELAAANLEDNLEEGDTTNNNNDTAASRAADRMRMMKKNNNNDPPEERQYARTAARGVTRTKSLKSSRVSTSDVANKLQAMRQNSQKHVGGAAAAPGSRESPKSTAQLKW